jgi:hypothetical protein
MKRLALLPFLVLGCVDQAAEDDYSFADGPQGGGKSDSIYEKSAEDVHLVLAEVVDLAQFHFGDINTNAEHPQVVDEVATNIDSSRCQLLAQQFPFSEHDCSEAVLADLARAKPELAGAPLIYPAIHKGGFNQQAQPAFGEWESNTKLVRIVVAAKRAAVEAQTFAGIGFHRIGYEFRSDLMYTAYAPGSQGERLFKETLETNHLVTGKAKRLGAGTRASDGTDVVFFEYIYFLSQNVKRPWISGRYEWMPSSSGINFKPFAEFHANGARYRNWDPRPNHYRINHDQTGVVVDFRSQFDGLTR